MNKVPVNRKEFTPEQRELAHAKSKREYTTLDDAFDLIEQLEARLKLLEKVSPNAVPLSKGGGK